MLSYQKITSKPPSSTCDLTSLREFDSTTNVMKVVSRSVVLEKTSLKNSLCSSLDSLTLGLFGGSKRKSV